MISDLVKPAITRVITPASKALLKIGMTPNEVTVIGAVGLVASALIFYPTQHFAWGTFFITLFVFSDLFDGTMARISQKGSSKWGGFLDSTIDRVTDSAVIIGLLLGLNAEKDRLVPIVAISLLTGILVPYIRAKAESMDIQCSGGLAERTERMIIILVAIFLHGLGVPFALAIGVWLLVVLGAITVVQRVFTVRKALQTL
ncbi:MAG: CDP-alcohol phosphatidyltransferase family protein [Actinomycetota bacterium]